jgi:quinol monooxygenase YgiN
MASDKVFVFASFTPADGKEGEVEAVLNGMCAPTRGEPGNEVYDLYKKTWATPDKPEGVTFHLFERYQNQAALDAHRETAHYKAYRATIMDLLAEPISVVVMADMNVGG